jgi:hypothetical protein
MIPPVVIKGTNSWQTILEADDYFASKFGADIWLTLSTAIKTQLLISAFNWIRQQPEFNIAPTATATIILQAQCETAWFIYKYKKAYDERQAKIAGGLTSYKIMDISENFDKIGFPAFIIKMLIDSADICGMFVHMHRDLASNNEE